MRLASAVFPMFSENGTPYTADRSAIILSCIPPTATDSQTGTGIAPAPADSKELVRTIRSADARKGLVEAGVPEEVVIACEKGGGMTSEPRGAPASSNDSAILSRRFSETDVRLAISWMRHVKIGRKGRQVYFSRRGLSPNFSTSLCTSPGTKLIFGFTTGSKTGKDPFHKNVSIKRIFLPGYFPNSPRRNSVASGKPYAHWGGASLSFSPGAANNFQWSFYDFFSASPAQLASG